MMYHRYKELWCLPIRPQAAPVRPPWPSSTTRRPSSSTASAAIAFPQPVGLHINDSQGGDDHLPPGEGKVDFAALKPMAAAARHIVFEPHDGVTEAALKKGLEHLKRTWGL